MFKRITFLIVSIAAIFVTLVVPCFADSYTVEENLSSVQPVYGLSGLSYTLESYQPATEGYATIRLDTLSDSYFCLGDDVEDIHPTWLYTEYDETGQVYGNCATFNTQNKQFFEQSGIGYFYGYTPAFFTLDTGIVNLKSDRYLTLVGSRTPSLDLRIKPEDYNSNPFTVYYSLKVLHYYDDNGTIKIGSTDVSYYKRVAPLKTQAPRPFMGDNYNTITIDLPSFDNIKNLVPSGDGYDYTFGDFYVFDDVVVSFSSYPHIEDGFIVENGIYQSNSNPRFNLDEYIFTSLEHEAIMEDFSLTGWVANVLGALFDVDIAPGISLGVILGFCLVVGLLFVFLRYFAGG